MNVVEKKMPPSSITTTPRRNPEPFTRIVNAGPFKVGNGDTESMTIGAGADAAWVPPQPS